MKQVFESDNIRFTEVSEELVKEYLVMVNDVEHVGRFIGPVREPFSEEKERRWVRGKLEEKALVFSMLEKTSGEFIGNIELMDPTEESAELGIAITAAKQDRGYGTEAVSALTAYGMARLGLKTITLRACPGNARAIHVYEKCGFREVRRTPEDVYMALSRAEPSSASRAEDRSHPGGET